MSSDLKSETARINGAKSHGPITPEGKARSAANSRRHGLTSSVLLEGESEEDFQLLLADFTDQFQPQTGGETDLVEVMTIARWRLRRLLAVETQVFELEMVSRQKGIKANKITGLEGRLAYVFQAMSDNSNTLTLLLRYEGTINRSYDKALKQLLQLQSNRKPREPLGSFRISADTPDSFQPSCEESLGGPSPDTLKSQDRIPFSFVGQIHASTCADIDENRQRPTLPEYYRAATAGSAANRRHDSKDSSKTATTSQPYLCEP